MSDIDKRVIELLGKVREKRAEIQKASKPSWKTHCSFDCFTGARVNIQVVNEELTLISLVSELMLRKQNWDNACKELECIHDFSYQGYSYDEWISDMKDRFGQILVSQKRKELAELEKRIDKLVSPEQRRKLELEEIENMLK